MDSNQDKSEVELDTVLSKFKMFGRHNLKFVIIAGAVYFTNELYFLNFVFAAYDVSYRCSYPECQGDRSQFLNSLSEDTICHKYVLANDTGSCALDDISAARLEPCRSWVYEEPDTFVEELSCHDWKRTLVGTVHAVGYMLGLILGGPLSDNIGRKKAVIILTLAGGIAGYIKSTMRWYWAYLAMELIEAWVSNSTSPIYLYVVEMSSKASREIFAQSTGFFSTAAHVLMAALAWLLPKWRHFLLALYAPALFSILYTLCMDESYRWLLSKGRKAEAVELLRKAAVNSDVHIPDETLNRLRCESQSASIGFFSLMKTTISSRKLFLRFLGCICMWITCCFNSQGLSINAVKLPGNRFLNYGLVSFVHLPSTLFLMYLLRNVDRKKSLVGSFLLSGTVCVAQPFIPKEYAWTALAFYILGKFMVNVSFGTVYLYTSELFPTYTRNTMHALCSAAGRVGGILAPQTPLLTRYWSGTPSALIGGLAIMTGIVSSLMPNTAHDILPDNVTQAETIGCKKPHRDVDKTDDEFIVERF